MNDSAGPDTPAHTESSSQSGCTESSASTSHDLHKKAQELMVLAESAKQNGNENLAQHLLQQARELFEKAKLMGSEWMRIADEKTQDIRQQTAAYTKENPMKALGVAAALGLLLGLIFKGKGRKR